MNNSYKEEGYQAFYRGDEDVNPHKEGSFEYMSWEAGYDEAVQENAYYEDFYGLWSQ